MRSPDDMEDRARARRREKGEKALNTEDAYRAPFRNMSGGPEPKASCWSD